MRASDKDKDNPRVYENFNYYLKWLQFCLFRQWSARASIKSGTLNISEHVGKLKNNNKKKKQTEENKI